VPVVRAPGRVNLIGDHTDYQDGLCLPMAIDRDVHVRFHARSDDRVRVCSREIEGTVEAPADGHVDPATFSPAWGRTVAAVLAVLAARGRAPVGLDAEIASDVPIGAGLSSSAALAVALALACAYTARMPLDRIDVARAAQDAEHAATGVPCGVMDQVASVFGQTGHALLLDCRTLEITPVALPDALAVVVAHSGVARRLEESAYAHRRASCEAAAARLGVATLRDARSVQVAGDPIARHVVSENERVRTFADALRRGNVERCGELMLESHASLRDDFGVSTIELDELVERLVEAGAYGARLTGAGFGGCAVALCAADRAIEIAQRTNGWIMHAAGGAGVNE
jgi:galactokinase